LNIVLRFDTLKLTTTSQGEYIMIKKPKRRKPLSTGGHWDFELIEKYYNEIERIAVEKFRMDVYPNQIEVISAEQMLDAYSSHGLPISYNHWSFGKSFVQNAYNYKKGNMGLAYEIVLNTKPCLAYLMEENTMCLQALVMAHACFGHNTVFKNNYMFKMWTDAESIVDYLAFAKKYISDCEDKYGTQAVEDMLDSCHSLQFYGVDKYKRPSKLSMVDERNKQAEREAYLQTQVNDLWRTIPTQAKETKATTRRFPAEPQENLLYFFEKNSPNLQSWQREIIRIVRKISQYFYPQMSTKVLNEGQATFSHYQIINEMYNEGLVDDGFMLEFFEHHTNVVRQMPFDSKYYSGINPYTLGFNIFMDIKRMCENPTEEDKEWFPDIVGKDWIEMTKFAMENFKDDSFIQQFLSPKVIRDMKLFSLEDDDRESSYEITAIHNKAGYKKVRETLANQYNIVELIPNIQVYSVDVSGSRTLSLRHYMHNERPLNHKEAMETLKHVMRLWGFNIMIESVDANNRVRSVFTLNKEGNLLDVFDDD